MGDARLCKAKPFKRINDMVVLFGTLGSPLVRQSPPGHPPHDHCPGPVSGVDGSRRRRLSAQGLSSHPNELPPPDILPIGELGADRVPFSADPPSTYGSFLSKGCILHTEFQRLVFSPPDQKNKTIRITNPGSRRALPPLVVAASAATPSAAWHAAAAPAWALPATHQPPARPLSVPNGTLRSVADRSRGRTKHQS